MKKYLKLAIIASLFATTPVKANETSIEEKFTTYLEEAKESTLWKDLKQVSKNLFNEIKTKYNQPEVNPNQENSTVLDKLNSLEIVEEYSEPTYNRKSYKHWINISEGWNTREEVLLVNGKDVEVYNNKIVSGTWFDYYTGKEVKQVNKVDIDHVVPLKLANKMGANNFTPEQKTQFANDLGNLVVTYNRVNRAKSDKGPSEWKPENPTAAKQYAEKFVEIAYKYKLVISEADYSALYEMLK